jgi:predicted DsbA family dithiol-disulfide isomerase
MPTQGMSREEYLKSKFGTKENAEIIYKRIADEGKLINIYFQFSEIKNTPNSFLSHKLLAYAHSKNKQTEVLESLFYQYFIEGNDIGRLKILIQIAKQTAIYENDLENYLISNLDSDHLLNEEQQARNIGIQGVPCFIFNKEFIINGAQPKKNFIKIINSINKNV